MEIFTFLGIVWAIWTMLSMFFTARNHGRQVELLREVADKTVRVIKLEPLDKEKTILAYDAETDAFLGQGKTVDEIKTNIMSRFPDKIFIMDKVVFSARPINEVQS